MGGHIATNRGAFSHRARPHGLQARPDKDWFLFAEEISPRRFALVEMTLGAGFAEGLGGSVKAVGLGDGSWIGHWPGKRGGILSS